MNWIYWTTTLSDKQINAALRSPTPTLNRLSHLDSNCAERCSGGRTLWPKILKAASPFLTCTYSIFLKERQAEGWVLDQHDRGLDIFEVSAQLLVPGARNSTSSAGIG